MLAGLLFAVQEAEDRHGALAATLPFAGMTLIEYQARLLITAGASQIVIVVARLTPELLGAVARIGRRGITVDSVRSAAEAVAKLHPLSRLIVLADGLVTTDAIVAPFAREGADAMLVLPETDGAPSERIGGGLAWGGLARLDARRLGEVAAMPRDYDVQAALLQAAGQAGALRYPLPSGEAATGHGVERRAAALEGRTRAVMGATLSTRPGWFDRWIVRPLVGAVLPMTLRHGIPSAAIAVLSGALGAGGLAALWGGQMTLGLIVALFGTIVAAGGTAFAWLRDEAGVARGLGVLRDAIPALAALLLGHAADVDGGEITAEVIAVTLVAAAALAERAAAGEPAAWWGTPPAYLLVLLLCVVAGFPTLGLAVAALYAGASLAAAIEALRRQA